MKNKISQTFCFVVLFILLCSKTISAQTEDTTFTLKNNMLGISTGIQFHEINNEMFNYKLNGYGGDIFYRHFFASLFDSTSIPFKVYLSANAGYLHYKHEDIKQENIAITAGPSLFLGEDFDMYLATEIGALYRTEEQTLNTDVITSSGAKLFVTVACGVVFPIFNSLNLELNFKERYAYKNIEQRSANLGLSYSF